MAGLQVAGSQPVGDVIAEVAGERLGAVQRIDGFGVIVVEDVRVSHDEPGQRSGVFFGSARARRLPLRHIPPESDRESTAAPWGARLSRRRRPGECGARAGDIGRCLLRGCMRGRRLLSWSMRARGFAGRSGRFLRRRFGCGVARLIWDRCGRISLLVGSQQLREWKPAEDEGMQPSACRSEARTSPRARAPTTT